MTNGAAAAAFHVLLVARLGIGTVTDVYFATLLLPTVLFNVTFGQLNNVLVPFFSARAGDVRRAAAFGNTMIGVTTVGALGAIALYEPVVGLLPRIFPDLAFGSVPDFRKLVAVQLLYAFVASLLVVKNCYLISWGKAVRMQVELLFGNLLAVALLWCLAVSSGSAVATCLLAGTAGSLLLVVGDPSLRRGWPLGSFGRDVGEIAGRTRLLMLNASVSKLEPLFDGVIASLVGHGMLTVLQIFERVKNFALSAVQNGYVLPATQRLAQCSEHGQWDRFRHAIGRDSFQAPALVVVLLAAVATALVAIRYSGVVIVQPYADVFIQHALAFAFFVGVGIGSILAKVYATGLYVLKDEWGFAKVSLVAFFLGVAVRIGGAWAWGFEGLVLGASISLLVYSRMLRRSLARSIEVCEQAGSKGQGVEYRAVSG